MFPLNGRNKNGYILHPKISSVMICVAIITLLIVAIGYVSVFESAQSSSTRHLLAEILGISFESSSAASSGSDPSAGSDPSSSGSDPSSSGSHPSSSGSDPSSAYVPVNGGNDNMIFVFGNDPSSTGDSISSAARQNVQARHPRNCVSLAGFEDYVMTQASWLFTSSAAISHSVIAVEFVKPSIRSSNFLSVTVESFNNRDDPKNGLPRIECRQIQTDLRSIKSSVKTREGRALQTWVDGSSPLPMDYIKFWKQVRDMGSAKRTYSVASNSCHHYAKEMWMALTGEDRRTPDAKKATAAGFFGFNGRQNVQEVL